MVLVSSSRANITAFNLTVLPLHPVSQHVVCMAFPMSVSPHHHTWQLSCYLS